MAEVEQLAWSMQTSTSLTRFESDWSGACGSNEASSKSTRDSLNLLQRFYATARHNLVPSGVLTETLMWKIRTMRKAHVVIMGSGRKRMEEEGNHNIFMLTDKMTFCKQTWWMMVFMLLVLQAALCTPATWLLSVKAIPVTTLMCEGPALARHWA